MSDFDKLKPRASRFVKILFYLGLLTAAPGIFASLFKSNLFSTEALEMLLKFTCVGSILVLLAYFLIRLKPSVQIRPLAKNSLQKTQVEFSVPTAAQVQPRLSGPIFIFVLFVWLTFAGLFLFLAYVDFQQHRWMRGAGFSITSIFLFFCCFYVGPNKKRADKFAQNAAATRGREVVFEPEGLRIASRLVDNIWSYPQRGDYYFFPWNEIQDFRVLPKDPHTSRSSSGGRYYSIKLKRRRFSIRINRQPFLGAETSFLEILQKYCPVPVSLLDDIT